VLDACYKDNLSSAQIRSFAEHFRRFPPVSIKLAPMHRHDSRFPGLEAYISLYEQSVLEGDVSLRKCLKSAESSDAIPALICLLIVLYLLGLMEPASIRQEKRAGVIGKVINRIRNL
jgi:hypothetical protein